MQSSSRTKNGRWATIAVGYGDLLRFDEENLISFTNNVVVNSSAVVSPITNIKTSSPTPPPLNHFITVVAAATNVTHEGPHCQSTAITDYQQSLVSTSERNMIEANCLAMHSLADQLDGSCLKMENIAEKSSSSQLDGSVGAILQSPALGELVKAHRAGDLESLSDEKFDFEIRTPEMSDAETDTPVKTLLDSPMSFREKVHAARAQLKLNSERSGTKDLDALFSMIRPDLPVTRPGSGDSAFADGVSTEEEQLLDMQGSVTPPVVSIRPSNFNRSNSLLRRRPESFMSGSMQDLVRKAQEQEKLLLEGARETARKYQDKQRPPTVTATPVMTNGLIPAASEISPIFVMPCRLSFDASPEAQQQQQHQQQTLITSAAREQSSPSRPSSLPRPRYSFVARPTAAGAFKLSTPTLRLPTTTSTTVTVASTREEVSVKPGDLSTLASKTLPTTTRGLSAATQRVGATASLLTVPPGLTTTAKPQLPVGVLTAFSKPSGQRTTAATASVRLPQEMPKMTRVAPTMTRPNISLPPMPKVPARPSIAPVANDNRASTQRLPLRASHAVGGKAATSRPAPPSAPTGIPQPPRSASKVPPSTPDTHHRKLAFADHIFENGVLRKLAPGESSAVTPNRYLLPPAMAQSVARLSTPKKVSPPKSTLEELAPPSRSMLKTPSPPKVHLTPAPTVSAVKRRLSFIPAAQALSLAPTMMLDSVGNVVTAKKPVTPLPALRRHTMTQKALSENLPHRQQSAAAAATAFVYSAKLIDLGDDTDNNSEPSSSALLLSCSGSINSNSENLLIDL
ncbi:hypothetical protein BV898_00445 [Hypsibius exemplaris]|uniref:Uncharacterized protein n=1 Tax=Hypsibius exemplaris TaxID=2072580 RepID=A0A1W0XDF1_HYPEX|nr:hypothetical protein BV898_00445 [Hypsibius exemplaris]